MKITRTVAVCGVALCLAFSGAGVSAQQSVQPGELPPVSFTGTQFVDSTGCVFTRIGIDDAVRWAPRVDRNRQHICGRAPTFATAATAAPVTENVIIPRGTEVVIEVPQLPPASTQAAAAPAPQVQEAPAQAEPLSVAAVAAAPVTAPAQVTRPTPRPVRAMVPVSAKKPVTRSAPSAPVGVVVTPETASELGVGDRDRVLPRHVWAERRDYRPVKVPKGYRKAWTDGRMNPRRAEQTLEGHRKMQQTWSLTAPMRERDSDR
ncbi:hypothetical protein [uncultured Roseobacter sp.]|uniref:hypothetical protein n=1 Tax=uncultured Roseobacter sp. TaxID=114847 RepID=UPI00260EB115|nr:hypothetical protein [uncultured Roseobacter sp.]